MNDALPTLLHTFFHDWMTGQRGASRHTILSYRDTWRLFLRFVADRRGKKVAALTLIDLDDQHVIAFLDHLEKDRGCTIATRNCRLAALHSFFGFVVDRDPLAAAQCAAVLRVPNKRAPKRPVAYLETDELEAILDQPDCKNELGQRDHTLLALLYNTGGRISEVLNLRPSAVRLDAPAQVQLYGKGRKERICPLWPETAELLAELLKRSPCSDNEVIFRNRYGEPLGATGVRFRLKRYVRSAAETTPRLADKRVSPHTFRHSTGVHMIAAGVDVVTIRDLLGHVSLDTTNIYAQADLETKRKAIEKADGKTRRRKAPRWKRDVDLLAWLDSL
jgi:site-specific recombinase XerD